MNKVVLFSAALLGPACVWTGAAAGAAGASAPLPPAAELPVRAELPDPLTMLDGRKVTSKKQWEKERRPELKRLFQHYMYGFMPPAPEKVEAKVNFENRQALGGKATLRELTLTYGSSGTPPLHLLMAVPNARKGRVPVFLGLNFCGNHAVLPDREIRIPDVWMYPNRAGVVNNRATEAGRGTQVDVWNVEQTIDRGYAFATFYSGDIDPDHPDFSNGVHAAYLRPGEQRKSNDWGAVAAWAWGFSRAVDYLVTDRDVDRKKIAIVGHSRKGKAALVAAAFDERIAMTIPLQAGMGGTAPSRGQIGESVERINTSFPHWFADTFKEFNKQPERLPFDQNALVALVAPRPVLFPNATEDTWANPEGQFEVLKAADPVYRFLDVEGLGSMERPPVGKLLDSRLGYFIRPGKHSMTREDWLVFLDFADKHFGKPRKR